jgi:hypothetical protein
MSEPHILSERASDGISRFAKLAERAQLETRGDKRVDVANRYAAARLALEPRERAIVDMMVLKRRTLGDLAVQTGQSVDSLGQLLSVAGERLADYFEMRGSDRSEGM